MGYDEQLWIDDDGSSTVGSEYSADRMNHMEAGIARAYSWGVRVAASTNVTAASAPPVIDGMVMVAGDRVLLTAQTDPAANGIWVHHGAGAVMTRASDADASGDFQRGRTAFVAQGTFQYQEFAYTGTDGPNLGVDVLQFVRTGEAIWSELGINPSGTFATVAERLDALLVPEAWRVVGASGQPAFTNGWVNFGGALLTARFYKDPLGMVHLSGSIKSGTIGQSAFTLPAGYRPSTALLVENVGAAGGIEQRASVQINADGTVRPQTVNGAHHLDAHFRAA